MLIDIVLIHTDFLLQEVIKRLGEGIIVVLFDSLQIKIVTRLLKVVDKVLLRLVVMIERLLGH